jgi:hypothetical protein
MEHIRFKTSNDNVYINQFKQCTRSNTVDMYRDYYILSIIFNNLFVDLEVCKHICVLIPEKRTTSVTHNVYIRGICLQHFLDKMYHRQVIRYKIYQEEFSLYVNYVIFKIYHFILKSD